MEVVCGYISRHASDSMLAMNSKLLLNGGFLFSIHLKVITRTP